MNLASVCHWRKVLVVVQQLTLMFECRRSNDAVVGLAHGDALLSQLAINVSRPNEDSFGHWQHNQWTKITPDPSVCGVIGYALEDLCQYDAAQGKVLVIENESLQCGHVRQITTAKEVDPDAGVNENH